MIFEFIRNTILPLNDIESNTPKRGKILDVGCGHGILCKKLARSSPRREILGIDPSIQKINLAKKGSSYFKKLRFKKSYIKDLNEKNFDCIIVIDVMYLFPLNEKVQFLKEIKKRLKKGGKFILKEVEKNDSYTDILVTIEETIMVKVFRKTYSDFKEIFIVRKKETKDILNNLGFKVVKESYIRGLLPYPHLLIIAKL